MAKALRELVRSGSLWGAWLIFWLVFLSDVTDRGGSLLFVLYLGPLYWISRRKSLEEEDQYNATRLFRSFCLAAVWVAIVGRLAFGVPIDSWPALLFRRLAFSVLLEFFYLAVASGVKSNILIHGLERTNSKMQERIEHLEAKILAGEQKLEALWKRFKE